MLLRSSSSPPPSSLIPSPDLSITNSIPQLRRSRSIPLHSSFPAGPLFKTLSETKQGRPRGLPPIPTEEDHSRQKPSLVRLLSADGLTKEDHGPKTPNPKLSFVQTVRDHGVEKDGVVDTDGVEGLGVKTMVVGGGCGSGGGRKVCGGGDGGGGFGFSDTDAYYMKMIEANPGDSLVLGNYAKYLKEVRGDLDKAEKYCERAILANPGDADVLSLYGELIWQTGKDADRAETYFDQAVKSAPQDSYVMASYARFLWDVDDDDDDEEVVAKQMNFSPPSFPGSTMPSVAAAS